MYAVAVPDGSTRRRGPARRRRRRCASISTASATRRPSPATPRFADQWALERIGWTDVFGNVSPAGSAVVALLDTGVDASHARSRRPARRRHLDRSTAPPATTDPNGHGTWMAGIIAAATDNGTGIAGVGYAGVRVMPVTVLGADGLGQDSDIIEGVVWAVQHGADVINMSFSNPGYSAVAPGGDRLRLGARRGRRRRDRQRRLLDRRPSPPATAASSASPPPTLPTRSRRPRTTARTRSLPPPGWTSYHRPGRRLHLDHRHLRLVGDRGRRGRPAPRRRSRRVQRRHRRPPRAQRRSGGIGRRDRQRPAEPGARSRRHVVARDHARRRRAGRRRRSDRWALCRSRCNVTSLTLGPQSTSLTYGTAGSATYAITLDKSNGNCSGTWHLPGCGSAPTGVSISSLPPGFSGSGSPKTATLTISRLATTPASSFGFTVSGGGGDRAGRSPTPRAFSSRRSHSPSTRSRHRRFTGRDPTFAWTYSGFASTDNAGNSNITRSASCTRTADRLWRAARTRSPVRRARCQRRTTALLREPRRA